MSTLFRRVSPYWLWALLSVPAVLMMWSSLTSDDARVIHKLLHPSGETSARLLIITMMATPLTLLFKGWRGPLWLKKNRRYFGVAAFGYALLHTVYYVVDVATLQRILDEAPRLYIWTGWLAFAIFIPLAVTSMDYFVRRMGTGWKRLQRWTYAAAVLTLVHWAALHNWESPMGAIVHFAPLALLEAYRVWFWYGRPRNKQAAAV
ncbi:sulfite oxidase heme-binding subunit YedZ [Litoreibacter janthinus]|uniref:Sulfoxide reductase heme-binding subunit YedZ n=1 Tax=Litoreibacter janthinus TaxID=670154 RepID=A0A1I6GH04_9RHOB|nr:ferric reductase-like transmembrane domain-containing protein [Litoreibacter janthinus]SFR41464.1 sulfoxide reductase heme-binding subunit YedZ [Litoreibacter janthinus]